MKVTITTVDNKQVFKIDPVSTEVAKAIAIRTALEWRGVYDGAEPYKKDNRVSYLGSSFISLQDGNTGNTPVGNVGDLFWDLIAEGGADGTNGADGADGADGTFSDVENVNALGSVSGVVEVNLSLGTVITATLTAPIELNVTGLPSANQVYAFTLVFSGVFEITYPAGTLFAGGLAPAITGTDYEIPCSINSAGVLRVYGVIDEVA